jgi:hypothetical protein
VAANDVRILTFPSLKAISNAGQVQQARYTVSPIVEADKFHFHLIKTHLTPNLEHKIGDLLDEINLAFDQEIGRPEGMLH